MKTIRHLPIPARRAVKKLGQDINEARRRRRISIELMAERSGLSRATVGKLERGEPSSSLGAYASVLFVLGMVDRLADLADGAHDFTGRMLVDEQLPKRVRLPRMQYKRGDSNE